MPSPPLSTENTGTVSSFHPEFESTQQFDTATQELHLRSSAQRFAYYHPPSPSMDVNSSFVRDSFPEFTEKSPSPESSISIEMARGAKLSPRHMDVSDIPLPNDSLYDLQSSPPATSRNTPNKKSDSLRKEASVRRAQSTDKKANASQRRSLSDMHRKVHQESESSFVGDDRPPTQTIHPRNTRFTSAHLPTTYSRDNGLYAENHTPQRPLANPTATWTGTQTQQSFILPDLPNITELVSGVRKDGTPVFSRSAKSRSRFTSGPYNNPTSTNTLTHHKINSVAVPEDEKAIFASLQLLKDKVANLEMDKSEAQKRLEEYESEVVHLKSRVEMEQKLRRPDSALGEDDEPGVKEKWRLERATLQSTIKALQARLDRYEREGSVGDIAVKRIAKERDDLVTQLGVAYYNSEELKEENDQLRISSQHIQADADSLRTENSRLRVKLAQIKAQFDDETHQWAQRESQLKAKVQRRDAAVRELQDITLGSAPMDEVTTESLKDRTMTDRRISGKLGQDTKHRILDRIENEVKRSRSTAAPSDKQRSRSRSKSNTRKAAHRPNRRASGPSQPEVVSEIDSTTDLDFSRTTRNENNEDDDSRDITYLSFLDPKELARLRKTLEEERRAAKLQRSASAPLTQDNETRNRTLDMPRKSSLKDVTKNDTGRFTVRTQVDENTGLLKNVRIQSPHMSDAVSYEEPKEVTEASMLSTLSRRRQRSKSIEEMTSAFILPDITLHTRTGVPTMDNINLGQAENTTHDQTNCTLCPPEDSQTKEITIPNPVPVSERTIDDTNATIRPSQPPPVALATVLKQLEDEVAHLKLQLSTYEKAYNAHDPALGRRKRRAVKEKMDALIAEIERRSDQVYALYDVLEGQKQDNGGEEENDMDEEQVEETLQSLGIDAGELAQRAAKTGREESGENVSLPAGLDALLGDSEDDMPWEGISDESDFEDVRLPKRRSASART